MKLVWNPRKTTFFQSSFFTCARFCVHSTVIASMAHLFLFLLLFLVSINRASAELWSHLALIFDNDLPIFDSKLFELNRGPYQIHYVPRPYRCQYRVKIDLFSPQSIYSAIQTVDSINTHTHKSTKKRGKNNSSGVKTIIRPLFSSEKKNPST